MSTAAPCPPPPPPPLHGVLTDSSLLLHITSFQRGLPYDIVQLAQRDDTNPFNSTGGSLPCWAVQQNDLPLLQRLFRLSTDQPMYQDDPKFKFKHLWLHALSHGGSIPMLEWIDKQPRLQHRHHQNDAEEILECAFSLPRLAQSRFSRSGTSTDTESPTDQFFIWLFTRHPKLMRSVDHGHLRTLAWYGCLETFQWLEANLPFPFPCSPEVMDAAAAGGNLEMVQFLHATRKVGWTTRAMDASPTLAITKFLHENRTEGCTTQAMDNAARFGRLEIVQFLHENRTEGCTVHAMDSAAAAGSLDIVQFLHEHRTEGCTTKAMDTAATLEITKFLHEHRNEGCTTLAMDNAAAASNMEMLRFLHDHRTEGCTKAAMDCAARCNRLDIVQFLHTHRSEGCTAVAIMEAARFGNVDIVRFLLENRPDATAAAGAAEAEAEANLKNAMEFAIAKGHLDVIRVLHNHWQPRCPSASVSLELVTLAVRHGQLQIVQFFQQLDPNLDYSSVVDFAALKGFVEILEFLVKIYPHTCTALALYRAAMSGDLRTLKFAHEHACEPCTSEVMAIAGGHGNLAMIKYLDANCFAVCQTKTQKGLIEAADGGHFRAVEYFVETRDHRRGDLFLLEARRSAKHRKHHAIEAYLTKIIDKFQVKSDPPVHNERCSGPPCRTQQA